MIIINMINTFILHRQTDKKGSKALNMHPFDKMTAIHKIATTIWLLSFQYKEDNIRILALTLQTLNKKEFSFNSLF